jgi:hypothetical protein
VLTGMNGGGQVRGVRVVQRRYHEPRRGAHRLRRLGLRAVPGDVHRHALEPRRGRRRLRRRVHAVRAAVPQQHHRLQRGRPGLRRPVRGPCSRFSILAGESGVRWLTGWWWNCADAPRVGPVPTVCRTRRSWAWIAAARAHPSSTSPSDLALADGHLRVLSGMDGGGDRCAACPTCSDGIQNQDEELADCGGRFCAACPTCSGRTQYHPLDLCWRAGCEAVVLRL